MTNSKKEISVACNYLLRLIKAHVTLSNEQINLFKRVSHDILSKRFLGHWFPGTPHRGSAYRCLQTKHWKDSVLRSIAERSRLPLHRYLPPVFTMWIDPGEVAVCFGDDGTWCPLYKHDTDGQIHQEYSDGEETVSSSNSDDDFLSVAATTTDSSQLSSKQLTTTDSTHSQSSSSSSIASSSRASSPFFNALTANPLSQVQSISDYDYSVSNLYSYPSISNDYNDQQYSYWPTQLTLSDPLLL